MKLNRKQQGAETLEFVIVFPFYLVMILAVFELARALYTWNGLAEATRRGARMAIICPQNVDAIKNVAVFKNTDGSSRGFSPVHGLTTAAIQIEYWKDPLKSGADDPIKFASVWIENFQYNSIFSFMNLSDLPGLEGLQTLESPLPVPQFRTTLYTESLGAVPIYPGDTAVDPVCNF